MLIVIFNSDDMHEYDNVLFVQNKAVSTHLASFYQIFAGFCLVDQQWRWFSLRRVRD